MFNRIKNKINNIIKKKKLKQRLLEKNIRISDAAQIPDTVLENIGEGCKFLGEVVIWGNVTIGRYSSINGPATRLYSQLNGITVGNFCSISSNVVIQEYNHKYDRLTSYFVNQNLFGTSIEQDIDSKGKISIEDDVWIGSNCVVLSGVTIGRGSIIGAGSTVVKDIPRYSIVVGNPAKVIKTRFSQEMIANLENMRWWEWDIEKIKQNKDLFNFTEKELLHNREFMSTVLESIEKRKKNQ